LSVHLAAFLSSDRLAARNAATAAIATVIIVIILTAFGLISLASLIIPVWSRGSII
jgi:hypothetical protein